MEGFGAVLMDGRPLPASSERWDGRGAVIAQLPMLLPEEGERQRRVGGDDVSMREKMTGKGTGPEKDGLGDGEEELGTGCTSSHTPVPAGSAEREPALRKRGRAGGTREASLRSL